MRLAICGNNCGVCPRYTASGRQGELIKVARLWVKCGWREYEISPADISCQGCSGEKQCPYEIVQCVTNKQLVNCGQCADYPCAKVCAMFDKTNEYARTCEERCTADEYEVLHAAFFRKRDNLNKEYIKENFKPEIEELSGYLESNTIIDYNDQSIIELADRFLKEQKSDEEIVKAMYEYVRDHISHSFDVMAQNVTLTASEVLQHGHGICYAKSHLLAALLRYAKIPTGFCYQKLILDDKTHPFLILHGLNAVYLKSVRRWIRLDARGNKPGVNAQFNLDFEQLAFPVRRELGEIDEPVIYVSPNKNVVNALKTNNTAEQLRNNLPINL